MKKVFSKKNTFIYLAIFVFVLFSYITYKTPLAGDDWGYALNGSQGTPIKSAIDLYYSWSGRFFSELWGMIVPCRKWLWNIINPLLFTGIFVCICMLGRIQKKTILVPLYILSVMLSVDDNLRMETYTWIMGTTYIVPLFLSLLYFLTIDRAIDKDAYNNKYLVLLYADNIFLIVIGLMMENIAATMIVAIIILLIYSIINKKRITKYLIINLFFSVISFVVMRLSPGSAYRLISEHGAWNELSLFEKLTTSYPNFLQMTFINNNYAIALFSIVVTLLVINTRKNNILKKTIKIIILELGILNVFSFVLGNSFLNDASSLYSYIFWPIYVVNAFICIFEGIDDKNERNKTILMLVVSGANALAMLYSPIYGSRSAVYTVYYLIVVGAIILENTNINKRIGLCLTIVVLCIIADRTYEFVSKYKLVGIREQERQEIIKYYQEHPEDEEAWIPRFSIYSIHGADIEPDDLYHLETFKEYFKMPQDANKIVFYFVEDK